MRISTQLLKGYFREIINILNLTTKRNFCAFSILKTHKPQSPVLFRLINSSCLVGNCGYMDLASVINVFEEHVPPTLAEKWDNTGLLIEPTNKAKISTIFFTNDLTEPVLNEAVSEKSDLIISYHPPIFSPLKSLTQSNWKDRIVIKCIENSIAVYSPHTGCDAVKGGVNDWLINCFDLSDCFPAIQSYEDQSQYSHIISFSAPYGRDMHEVLKSVPNCQIVDSRRGEGNNVLKVKVSKSSLNTVMKLLTNEDSRSSMYATPLNPLPLLSCGMGRIGTLTKPLSFGECIKAVKAYLKLDHIRYSQGISHSLDTPISVVAVCAGSGSSVLKGVRADLYITGEMSHHDLLDANHRNVSVILCEHSNSERGYLQQLVETLSPKLSGIKLIVSTSDKDPISIN